jgi:hypothetical protein
MLPFGVGQFQNGQDALGYTLLVVEGALSVTSIASYMVRAGLIADSLSVPGPIDVPKFQSQVNTARDVNHYATGALAVVALAGMIHAQATFVPEVQETRLRPLPPPPPSVVPKVGAGPAGFFLGVSGRF